MAVLAHSGLTKLPFPPCVQGASPVWPVLTLESVAGARPLSSSSFLVSQSHSFPFFFLFGLPPFFGETLAALKTNLALEEVTMTVKPFLSTVDRRSLLEPSSFTWGSVFALRKPGQLNDLLFPREEVFQEGFSQKCEVKEGQELSSQLTC